MTLLYLDAVNSTLKRIGVIAGDSANLVSATSTATTGTRTGSDIFNYRSDIQHSVDLVIEMWNEAALEIYAAYPNPNLVATATIVIAANTRSYSLPDDFERVAGDNPQQQYARAATEQMWLIPYPGGYLQMLSDQGVATDWVGEPTAYSISPTDTTFVIDRTPTATGSTYNLAYERRIELTSTMATATMPFSDSVVRNLVPVVAEFYEHKKKKQFDVNVFRSSLIRAFSYAHKAPPRRGWGVRQWQ